MPISLRPLVPLLVCLLVVGCASGRNAAEADLLVLSDGHHVVGLLPQVGGRLVSFRFAAGANVLLADPQQWTQTPPQPAADAGWRAYNGHIAWLGPQAEWWTRTPLNPKRAERAATWPPDPWLIYGDYAVVASSPTHAVLQGPASPLSGVTLTKRYELTDGRLAIGVTATNSSDQAVSWDLWANTRFPGASRCYVPIPPTGAAARIELGNNSPTGFGAEFAAEIDGYFTLRNQPGSASETVSAAVKYFMDPAADHLGIFPRSGGCLVKRIEVAQAAPAPDQGRVEIYWSRRPDRTPLLEVEHHGPYTTLAPDESMTQREVWTLHPYAGGDDATQQIAFLRRVVAAQTPADAASSASTRRP